MAVHNQRVRSSFDTYLRRVVASLALVCACIGLACTAPSDNTDASLQGTTTQRLGQSDYPVPGQMVYRPPRILSEEEGVRVVFDLVNGRTHPLRAVILRIVLWGPAGERRIQEIYVGPMLARETKRISTLVEDIDFMPDDLTVELLQSR